MKEPDCNERFLILPKNHHTAGANNDKMSIAGTCQNEEAKAHKGGEDSEKSVAM